MSSGSGVPEVRLGLRANLGQFSLLVLVNAFVGAMVGLERSILPGLAEHVAEAPRSSGRSLPSSSAASSPPRC